MYYNVEEQEKAIQETIANYRYAAALYSAVRPVIERYNQKVFNKRLCDAIQDVLECNVYAVKDRLYTRIEALIHGDHITILNIDHDKLIDGKRIDSDILLQDMRSRRETLLQKAARIETEYNQLETTRKQLEALDKARREIVDRLPSEITYICGIKRH